MFIKSQSNILESTFFNILIKSESIQPLKVILKWVVIHKDTQACCQHALRGDSDCQQVEPVSGLKPHNI